MHREARSDGARGELYVVPDVLQVNLLDVGEVESARFIWMSKYMVKKTR